MKILLARSNKLEAASAGDVRERHLEVSPCILEEICVLKERHDYEDHGIK